MCHRLHQEAVREPQASPLLFRRCLAISCLAQPPCVRAGAAMCREPITSAAHLRRRHHRHHYRDDIRLQTLPGPSPSRPTSKFLLSDCASKLRALGALKTRLLEESAMQELTPLPRWLNAVQWASGRTLVELGPKGAARVRCHLPRRFAHDPALKPQLRDSNQSAPWR